MSWKKTLKVAAILMFIPGLPFAMDSDTSIEHKVVVNNSEKLLHAKESEDFAFGERAVNRVATIYLIRHAEKQAGKNPHLTETGLQRANFYRDHWRDLPIRHIFSTEYHRTQATVNPIAQLKKITVSAYDPRDLENFADVLKFLKGHIIVVGHSNTTPQLANLIGVDAQPMNEDEYSRIYRINLLDGELIDWVILHSVAFSGSPANNLP